MMAFALQQVFQAAVSGFMNFLNVSLLVLYFFAFGDLPGRSLGPMVPQFSKLVGKLLEVSAQITGINWPISFCLQLENFFLLEKGH